MRFSKMYLKYFLKLYLPGLTTEMIRELQMLKRGNLIYFVLGMYQAVWPENYSWLILTIHREKIEVRSGSLTSLTLLCSETLEWRGNKNTLSLLRNAGFSEARGRASLKLPWRRRLWPVWTQWRHYIMASLGSKRNHPKPEGGGLTVVTATKETAEWTWWLRQDCGKSLACVATGLWSGQKFLLTVPAFLRWEKCSLGGYMVWFCFDFFFLIPWKSLKLNRI